MKRKSTVFISMLVLLALLSCMFTACGSEEDALYMASGEAYTYENMTVYAVFAPEAGTYPLSVKGISGKDLTVQVNGIDWNGTWKGKTTEVTLNKGINSIQLTSLVEGETAEGITVEGLSESQDAGAQVLYTAYEAEKGETNGEIYGDDRTYRTIASEASERSCVELKDTGDYVSVTLEDDANALVIRYSIPDSEDGEGLSTTIALQVGEDTYDLPLTSHYSWVYGLFPWSNDPAAAADGGAHHFFDDARIMLDKTYPAGTVITIRKEAQTDVDFCIIDLIEAEEVDAPLPMPENALSIVDFGAVPDDGIEDGLAIEHCIEAALKEGKEVYIPAGEFLIQDPFYVNGIVLRKDNVVIRGAGMWHTILHGNASGFAVRAGNIAFYDFSLVGEVTSRLDTLDPPAFDMTMALTNLRNVRFQNVWIEHYKVGLWADVTNGISMMGCRIRNTFADGVNLCGGTSNSVITQNDVRNTGDDGIAMFSRGVADENILVTRNTVSNPWLANHIAAYGGKDITISKNLLKDSVLNGGGVNISTNFEPQVFQGTILVEDNEMRRCGGTNYEITCGAIWVNTLAGYDNNAECIFRNNTISDSSYYGVSFHNSGTASNLTFENNTITGGTIGFFGYTEAQGNVKLINNDVSDTEAEALVNYASGKLVFEVEE